MRYQKDLNKIVAPTYEQTYHITIKEASGGSGGSGGQGESEITSSSGSSGALCSHDFCWITEIEPTETENGEQQYKCSKCGEIELRQPLSAYAYFVSTSVNKIKKAPSGSEVTISSKLWNSYPKELFEELANRRDITTVIQYMDDQQEYDITINANQEVDTSCDYYGPQKLIELYSM